MTQGAEMVNGFANALAIVDADVTDAILNFADIEKHDGNAAWRASSSMALGPISEVVMMTTPCTLGGETEGTGGLAACTRYVERLLRCRKTVVRWVTARSGCGRDELSNCTTHGGSTTEPMITCVTDCE